MMQTNKLRVVKINMKKRRVEKTKRPSVARTLTKFKVSSNCLLKTSTHHLAFRSASLSSQKTLHTISEINNTIYTPTSVFKAHTGRSFFNLNWFLFFFCSI